METRGLQVFKWVEQLAFTRISGSPQEKQAAEFLLKEICRIGEEGRTESFPMTCYTVERAQLELLSPCRREYPVRGYGLSGQTPPGGITAGFAYIEQAQPLFLRQAAGKIVMVNGSFDEAMYHRMMDAGAVGFLTYSGSVSDSIAEIRQRELNGAALSQGKLPGLVLHVRDAIDIVKAQPAQVRMLLRQTESEGTSQNVIAEVRGTSRPSEVICLSAHYDSTPQSKGAFDNGTGAALLLYLLSFFYAHPPARTLRFLWFGAEERGMLGSQHYVRTHCQDLDSAMLVFNIDMAGAAIGTNRAYLMTDPALESLLQQWADEADVSLLTFQDTFPSDCLPFAATGIPALSIGRFGSEGSAICHAPCDDLFPLSVSSMETTARLFEYLVSSLANELSLPSVCSVPPKTQERAAMHMKKYQLG